MEHVTQAPRMVPEDADVDYTPLGGKVGLTDEAKGAMTVAGATGSENIVVSHEIENTYGNPGEGEILNHLRRRNLGLI